MSTLCSGELKRRLRQSVYVMSGVTAAVMAYTRLAIGAYCVMIITRPFQALVVVLRASLDYRIAYLL